MIKKELYYFELQKAFDKIVRYLKTLPEDEKRDELLVRFSPYVKESFIEIPPKFSVVEVLGNNGEWMLMYSCGTLDVDDSLYASNQRPFEDYECHSWRVWRLIK